MKTKHSASKRLVIVLLTVLLILSGFAAVCYYFDPFCHFHAPLAGHSYNNVYPYYLNDGIIRQYDFTGIITGTSMTENFKASEAEQLFGGRFIKIPLSGTSFPEMTDQLKRAYRHGKAPQYVIRSLDPFAIVMRKDEYMRNLAEFDYLYNDLLFDDIKYLLNLEVFCKYTLDVFFNRISEDEPSIDFDSYCSWDRPTGKEAVLERYSIDDFPVKESVFSPEDRERIAENIRCNITDIAYEHPETTFFYFYPPYSIVNWATAARQNTLHSFIESMKTAAEEMLKCPNIRLFGFDDHYDITCDLNNYKDPTHYCSAINSLLLEYMSENVSLLTPENYLDYFDRIERFYSGYDYEGLFK